MFNLIEGKVVEQPGIEKPEFYDYVKANIGNTDSISGFMLDEVAKYETYIASLRNYTADLSKKWVKETDLEIDVDFEVNDIREKFSWGSAPNLIAIPKEGSGEDELWEEAKKMGINQVINNRGRQSDTDIITNFITMLKPKYHITKK